MAVATHVLPVVVKGYLVEPKDGKFVETGKTWLQFLYEDSQTTSDSPRIFGPSPVRLVWKYLTQPEYLKDGKPDPQLFHDETVHKPYGAEAGDLSPVLEQLAEEMHDNYLFVNGAFVVDNTSGLVLNLGNTQLPAFVTHVGVYTEKIVTPKSEQGTSLDEFKQAGGKLVAYRTFPAGQYQLKHNEWTPMSEGVEPVGVMPGDKIYANLDPKHSDGVKALDWDLRWPGERPSDLDAGIGLDDRDSDGGVLRGRRLNIAGSYQEQIHKVAGEMERLARQFARQLRSE